LKQQLGSNVKPIPVASEITEYLDSKKRLDFLAQWKAGLGTK
jgi:iron(III) transport system substrate-binding protein